MGTPNRWELPTTTSAPMVPGLFSTSNAIKSVANTDRASSAAMASTNAVKSSTFPLASGYCTKYPNTPPSAARAAMAVRGKTSISNSRCAARVRRTLKVWGKTASSTKNVWAPALACARGRAANNIAMASEAAVPSSSNDAFATSMSVRSVTIVWKLSKASKRPWAISAWYGVYAVYHPGFSSTFRRITLGTSVG